MAQPPDSLRDRLGRWLFRVGHTPEPAPVLLVQRRIFVLPTPAGLAFAATLVVLLLASINYNLSLGYALVFLLGGVAVASILHAFRNLLHLSLSPGRAEPVFAGETPRYTMLVSHTRDSRRPALRLKAHGVTTAFDLGPGDTAEAVLPGPAGPRGWRPLGRIAIETTYPLGFIRAWSVLVPDLRCLVYPAPEAAPPPLPAGSGQGTGIPHPGSGDDDFAGLRPWQTSDSPRRIAWKTLARGGPMLAKQFTGLDSGDLQLDWHSLPDSLDTESRLSRLTAWVLAAGRNGQAFSLTLPDGSVTTGHGPQHIADCLRRLALFGLADRADA